VVIKRQKLLSQFRQYKGLFFSHQAEQIGEARQIALRLVIRMCYILDRRSSFLLLLHGAESLMNDVITGSVRYTSLSTQSCVMLLACLLQALPYHHHHITSLLSVSPGAAICRLLLMTCHRIELVETRSTELMVSNVCATADERSNVSTTHEVQRRR